MMFLKLKAIEYGGYFGAGVKERTVLIAIQDVARIAEAEDGVYVYLRDGEAIHVKTPLTELLEGLEKAGFLIKP